MGTTDTSIIQITNIAPSATKEQIETLFGFLGKILRCELYPESEYVPVPVKVAFVHFEDPENCGVAMHLTNTVFIDRALIVIPILDGKIPDEGTAIQQLVPGGRLMPGAAIPGLSCPVITGDEQQRTIYVGNLDPTSTTDGLLQHFCKAGEIKYMRMGGEETPGSICAFIEYTEIDSMTTALGFHMTVFNGRPVRVIPSNTAIIKPQTANVTMAGLNSKELDEAMKKVKEASSLIQGTVESELSRSRTRSRSRKRSRSRSHHRSSKHRSRSRSRRSRSRRSGSRGRKKRSRSKDRKSSRRYSKTKSSSKTRRKSRSPERGSRSRRSKSRDRKRSKSRDRKRSKSRERKRSKSRDRKRSKSRDRRRSTSKGREKKEKEVVIKKESEEVKKEEEVAEKEIKKEEDSENLESGTESPVKPKRKEERRSRRTRSRSPRADPKKESSRNKNRSRSRSPANRRRRSRSGSRSRRSRDVRPEPKRKRSTSPRASRSRKDRRRTPSPEHKRDRSRDRKRRKRDKDTKPKVIKRDYDEEEKGFNASSEVESDKGSKRGSPARETDGEEVDRHSESGSDDEKREFEKRDAKYEEDEAPAARHSDSAEDMDLDD